MPEICDIPRLEEVIGLMVRANLDEALAKPSGARSARLAREQAVRLLREMKGEAEVKYQEWREENLPDAIGGDGETGNEVHHVDFTDSLSWNIPAKPGDIFVFTYEETGSGGGYFYNFKEVLEEFKFEVIRETSENTSNLADPLTGELVDPENVIVPGIVVKTIRARITEVPSKFTDMIFKLTRPWMKGKDDSDDTECTAGEPLSVCFIPKSD